ncbi:MAG TPA: hypothetical protein VMD91_05865 [Candidatus Sulfotelmatobacter sp.]|nr:hypothetical protein [Candidatus Sulfotelmatobacter sp.]
MVTFGRSIVASCCAALALGATGIPARASLADALTPFALNYRQNIDQTCDQARQDADRFAARQGAASAAEAHAATRAFLDCAAAGAVEQTRLNRYFLMAGAAELLAAERETGEAAIASRRNAIAILQPLLADPQVSFNEAYRNAPAANGENAIVPIVEEFGPFRPRRSPSVLAPTAANLIDIARAGVPAPAPTARPASN